MLTPVASFLARRTAFPGVSWLSRVPLRITNPEAQQSLLNNTSCLGSPANSRYSLLLSAAAVPPPPEANPILFRNPSVIALSGRFLNRCRSPSLGSTLFFFSPDILFISVLVQELKVDHHEFYYYLPSQAQGHRGGLRKLVCF